MFQLSTKTPGGIPTQRMSFIICFTFLASMQSPMCLLKLLPCQRERSCLGMGFFHLDILGLGKVNFGCPLNVTFHEWCHSEGKLAKYRDIQYTHPNCFQYTCSYYILSVRTTVIFGNHLLSFAKVLEVSFSHTIKLKVMCWRNGTLSGTLAESYNFWGQAPAEPILQHVTIST